MDGITEYRNTFENPRVEHDFLRPAPVDVVACAGRVDERHLRGLGNDAIATGLPRLRSLTLPRAGSIPMRTNPLVPVLPPNRATAARTATRVPLLDRGGGTELNRV